MDSEIWPIYDFHLEIRQDDSLLLASFLLWESQKPIVFSDSALSCSDSMELTFHAISIDDRVHLSSFWKPYLDTLPSLESLGFVL